MATALTEINRSGDNNALAESSIWKAPRFQIPLGRRDSLTSSSRPLFAPKKKEQRILLSIAEDEQSGGSGRDGMLGHRSRLPRLRFCRRTSTFPFLMVFSTFSNILCPGFLQAHGHHVIKHLIEGRSYRSVSVPSI